MPVIDGSAASTHLAQDAATTASDLPALGCPVLTAVQRQHTLHKVRRRLRQICQRWDAHS
ncbi:hypothetical protein ACTG13_16370 [Aeromonas hydrophila]|uniref:hypothetical protein n=1 Tax=Aeromonas hydrophila TaxID=644 RepID=UPI003F79525D